MSTIDPNAQQLSAVEASNMADTLVMQGALDEVLALRTVVQDAGMLALESTVDLANAGRREFDRVTHVAKVSLRYAVHETTEATLAAPLPHGISERQIRQSGLRVIVNGTDSMTELRNLREVIPEVFERQYAGQQITGEEHDGIARNSFGIARRVANKNGHVAGAIINYLKKRPNMFSLYDPTKFAIDEGPEGPRLALAMPEELAGIVEEARQQARDMLYPPKPGRQCPALAISNDETNLVRASWDLMIDLQAANRTVTPMDRAKRYAAKKVGSLANKFGL